MVPSDARPDSRRGGVEAIIDSLADLLQTAADWVRQEAGSIVHDKVVMPIQRLGLTLASAFAAGCLLVLGLTFVAVALFLYLAQWLGYPGALLLIGVVYLIGAGVFIAIKARSMQQ